MERQLDTIIQTMSTGYFHKYKNIIVITPLGNLHTTLRWSSCRRKIPERDEYVRHVDIVSIGVDKSARRKGLATMFILSLMKCAAKKQRDVYVEQCITTDSKALMNSTKLKPYFSWVYESAIYNKQIDDDLENFVFPEFIVREKKYCTCYEDEDKCNCEIDPASYMDDDDYEL